MLYPSDVLSPRERDPLELLSGRFELPRIGEIVIHDCDVSLWESSVDEVAFKKEVFDPLIRHMRKRGWRVGQDKQIKKNHACLRPYYRQARTRHGLEAKLSISGRHLEIKLFQNVENVSNPHGGEYEFGRFEKMPYLTRLLCLVEMNALTSFLQQRHGYSLKIRRRNFECGPRRATAVERIRERIKESWHYKPELGRADYGPDYNRRSADGGLLEHSQQVWVRDEKGRWLRGRAFYNLNSMWLVAVGRYTIRNVPCSDISIQRPDNLRLKDNARQRRVRLNEELHKAVSRMDYLRAHQIKKVLLNDQPGYRIWSRDKRAWYRAEAQGYADIAHAGIFSEERARQLVGSHEFLEMRPVEQLEEAAAAAG